MKEAIEAEMTQVWDLHFNCNNLVEINFPFSPFSPFPPFFPFLTSDIQGDTTCLATLWSSDSDEVQYPVLMSF